MTDSRGGSTSGGPGAVGPARPAVPPMPPPDMPRVPRSARSGWTIAVLVYGLLVTGGYAAVAFTGYEPGTPERDAVPASVRSSPGGYRTFHFWHSGYHGGK